MKTTTNNKRRWALYLGCLVLTLIVGCPPVKQCVPFRGPMEGDNRVKVYLENPASSVSGVYFNDVACQIVGKDTQTDQWVEVIAPGGEAGPVDVKVHYGSVNEWSEPEEAYTYEDTNNDRPGFITLSEDGRHFQDGNGNTFIPIGHNDWSDVLQDHYTDADKLDAYFAYMAEHGENLVRLILDGPESMIELEVGQFNPELIRGMDYLVSAAERHGIYLIVTLFPNLYGDYNWTSHTYHDLVENLEDLLSDPLAIEAAKNRMRFFVEWWGSSPNIFAWELINEMNPIGTVEQQNAWIQEIGAFTRELETELYGSHHLRTVSTGNAGCGTSDSGIFTSTELDFTSYHTYDAANRVGVDYDDGQNGLSRIDPIRYFEFMYQSARTAREKSNHRPVLGTEDYGIADPNHIWPGFRGYTQEQLDDFFSGSAWSSFMAGGAGPNLRWPCIPVYGDDDPNGYRALSTGMYKAQRAIRDILSKVDLNGFSPAGSAEAVSTGDPDGFVARALSNGDDMLIWILNTSAEFSREAVNTSVSFHSLQNASYTVTWYDLRTGDVLGVDNAQGPEFTLQTTPDFETFVVAVVEMD